MTAKKPASKSSKAKAKQKGVTYIHIDEFLRGKEKELGEDIIRGFKVYMRGKSYQHSMKDFEKELKNFFNRKI